MDIKRISENNTTVERERNIQIKIHCRDITVKNAQYIEIRKQCENITINDVEDIIIYEHCKNITINNAKNVLIRRHCDGITINNAENVKIKEHSGKRRGIEINSNLNVLSLSDFINAEVQNVDTIYGSYQTNNIIKGNVNEVKEDRFYNLSRQFKTRMK
jgi:hypothetical protein